MLMDYLSKIADHRRDEGKRYPLKYVLLFSVLAVLSGATSYRKIQRFMKAHRKRLNEFFGSEWKRAPAHTSIRSILKGVEPKEIEQAFRNHSKELLGTEPISDTLKAIAIDGKVLRGSFDRFQDQKAAQILSAFCQNEHLILGHLPVSTKTNEIPVAQQLIEELGLNGCVYTLDALHCQKKTFDAVLKQDAQIVVQIKDNQPTLFKAAKRVETDSKLLDQASEHDIGKRNRIEIRDVKVFDAASVLANSPELKDWSERIVAIIQVYRNTDCFDTKTGNWKNRSETSYYAASHLHSAGTFAQLIRNHWGTENRNHYVRDVTLGEDASRIRCNPGIFARLRSFTLNILRKNKISNVSEALYDNALCFDNLIAYVGVL